MATRIQVRRDTAVNWTTVNPILAEGEIGCDLTTTQIKVGNGTDTWNDLPYTAGDGSLWAEASGVVAPVTANAKVRANAQTVAADDALTLVTKGYLEALDVTVSDAAPSGAVQGQLWWNTDVGRMFIYYVDADSTEQWVETAPSQNFLYWERTGTAVHPATDTDSVFVGDNGDGTAAVELNPDGTSQFSGEMTLVDNTDSTTITLNNQAGTINLDGLLTGGGAADFNNRVRVTQTVAGGLGFVVNDGSNNRFAVNQVGELRIGPDINDIPTLNARIESSGDATFAGNLQCSSLNEGQLAGFRNLLINGEMIIQQRPSQGSFDNEAEFIFDYRASDRWVTEVSNSGGTIYYDWTRDTDAPPGFSNSFKVEATADNTLGGTTGTQYNLIGQKIENANLLHLLQNSANAKPFTISFWVKSNLTGNDVVELVLRRVGSGSMTSFCQQIDITAADTWEYKTITVPGNTISQLETGLSQPGLDVWFSLQGVVESYTMPSYGSWLPVNALGGPAGTTNRLVNNGDYIQITGCQLEEGPVATPFEHRALHTELTFCQRYYQRYEALECTAGYRPYLSDMARNNPAQFMLPVQMLRPGNLSVEAIARSNTGATNSYVDATPAVLVSDTKTLGIRNEYSQTGVVHLVAWNLEIDADF